MLLAGIDEAGRGPVLGPLVVAGVASSEDEPFSDLGLRDSKQLTPRAREKLAAEIRARADAIHLVVADADEIDMWRRTMTLNEVEVRLFTTVARALAADAYVLDACDVDARRFGLDVQAGLPHRCQVFAAHRADEDEPIVSAASIVAKVERDRRMELISRRAEQVHGLPAGSGYPSDPVTRHYIDHVVKTTGRLPEASRQSWKTASDALLANGIRVHDHTLDAFTTRTPRAKGPAL